MKYFLKILLLSSLSCPIFCMEKDTEENKITIIWPHIEGEVGLQQRMAVIVPGIGETEKHVDFFVVDQDDNKLTLCVKKKKDHTEVIKVLNREYPETLNCAKADITFYCKGANCGGCKTKRPAQVKLVAEIFNSGTKELRRCESGIFLVRGNRRYDNNQKQNENNKRLPEHNNQQKKKPRQTQPVPNDQIITININNSQINSGIICFKDVFVKGGKFNNIVHQQTNFAPEPKNRYKLTDNNSYRTFKNRDDFQNEQPKEYPGFVDYENGWQQYFASYDDYLEWLKGKSGPVNVPVIPHGYPFGAHHYIGNYQAAGISAPVIPQLYSFQNNCEFLENNQNGPIERFDEITCVSQNNVPQGVIPNEFAQDKNVNTRENEVQEIPTETKKVHHNNMKVDFLLGDDNEKTPDDSEQFSNAFAPDEKNDSTKKMKIKFLVEDN